MNHNRKSKIAEAKSTAPGVRLLKDLWNIDSDKRIDDVGPFDHTVSNIYQVPDRSNPIPRRSGGRAVR